ncbi:MAG: hypothetical protein ACOZNI_08605 [Myxococcota bacterium]
MTRLFVLIVTVALARGDAPEISRSLGKKGGVVVLWPRVSGEGDVAAAAKVQTALAKIAGGVSDTVDVRPQPERVCPKETGCKATALGAVVVVKGQGCAVVATVSAPGQSPATLVPWAAEMKLKSTMAGFREPPEPQVVVTDFTPCAQLDEVLAGGAEKVAGALRGAMGG